MAEPAWLTKARSYIGFHEKPDNRGIEDFIELAHCGQIGDPWCAIFANACLESVGVKGTRSPAAASFTEDANFAATSPQLGAIVTFKRTGGNHVGFYVGQDGDQLLVLGGNQSDQVCIDHHANNPTGYWWPKRLLAIATGDAPDEHPLVKLGSIGPAVAELQRLLGIDADGEFGAQTYGAVRQFQAAHGIEDDGEVGLLTWTALLGKLATVGNALTQATIDQIVSLARNSALAAYQWKDRGRAPVGYINGMAAAFARVYLKLKAGDSAALAMTVPIGDPEQDALAWYGTKAEANRWWILRELFALLYGLGMRESSGNCFEGRDMSASNTTADTAEAGLFQQSWDSHGASPELPKLLAAYHAGVAGFLSIFREGVNKSPTENAGSGDGAAFQALCKAEPAFAVEAAAIGLRAIRKHWGPINRKEAEVRPEAEQLLLQIQSIVDAQPATQGVPPVADTTPTPDKPPALPAPTSQFDLLRMLKLVIDNRDESHSVIDKLVKFHNAVHPDKAVSLPPAPPVIPPTSGGSLLDRPSVQLGGVGLVLTGIMHQLGALDPNMAILGAIVSAGTAFLGPAGGIVGKIIMNIVRAAWQAEQSQPPQK